MNRETDLHSGLPPNGLDDLRRGLRRAAEEYLEPVRVKMNSATWKAMVASVRGEAAADEHEAKGFPESKVYGVPVVIDDTLADGKYEIDAQTPTPKSLPEPRYGGYLPMDCPNCGRRRLECWIATGDRNDFVCGIQCEKCYRVWGRDIRQEEEDAEPDPWADVFQRKAEPDA